MAKWHASAIACLLVCWMSILYEVAGKKEDFTFLELKNMWMKQGHNLSKSYSDEHTEVEVYGDVGHLDNLAYRYSRIFKEAKELYNLTCGTEDRKIYVVMHKRCTDHKREIHSNMSIGMLNVIQCEYYELNCYWNSVFREKCYSDYFMPTQRWIENQVVNVVINHFISAEGIPKHLLSDWKVVNLLRHYAEPISPSFRTFFRGEISGDFPQKRFQHFTRWYKIIYEKYGQGKVVREFLQLIKNLTEKDLTLRDRAISPGEFVHLWSTAVKDDLRYLAFMSFGWTNEYQEQFEDARKRFPSSNYEESFTNYTRLTPISRCIKKHPNIRQECEDSIQEKEQVAFSIPLELRNRTFFIREPLVQAWSYVSDTYGRSEHDPYLYFKISDFYFYGQSDTCSLNRDLSSYLPKIDYAHQIGRIFFQWHENSEHFIEIACPLSRKNKEIADKVLKQVENLPAMFRLIATNVIATSKETGDWPAQEISGDSAVDAVNYDILVALGRTQDANEWANAHFERTLNSPRENTFWMRDWLLPLYTHFHGSRALTAFIEQLSAHWPKQGTDYRHQLNVGQFVHFWSAGLNKDLRALAEKTFGWNETFQDQFEHARSRFSHYNYTDDYVNGSTFSPPLTWKENDFGHREILTLVKEEKDVVFYKETNTNSEGFPSWPLQLMSNAWLHVKGTYGPFSDDPNLHVILHEEKHEGCVTSTLQNTFNHKSVLDCGLSTSLSWNVESQATKDLLVQGLASLVLGSLKWTGPSGSPLRSNDWRWHLRSILAYDIYSSLNNTLDLSRWTKKRNEKSDVMETKFMFGKKDPVFDQAGKTVDSMNRKMHLFHNWMIPLYTKYGGTKVLQNFVRILKENLPQQEPGCEKWIRVGEFVHFWSGAVGVDLESFAKKSFGLGTQMYRSIDKARRQYPKISYSDMDPEMNSGKQKQPKTSQIAYEGNSNLIIGISVPVGVIVLSVVVIIYLRQQRQINILKEQNRKLTQNEMKDFFDGAPRVDNAEGNALIESEPFNKDFEIARSALDLKSGIVLGSGEYGVVLKGILKVSASSIEIPECVTVAVKTPKPDVDVATFKALLSELKVMGHIGRHDNVIKLLGAVTVNIKNRELFVALEFCWKGDLLSYMRRNREDFKDLLKKEEPVAGPSSSLKIPKTRTDDIELKQMPSTSQNYENLNNEFSTLHLLEWARQIANGMNFIGVKKVIHGDLAARNVLLTADRVAKISDFGLSRQLVNYTNYTKKSEDTPMPWRWMALESLLEMKFSSSSDVWAFGVTLFEIFSLGSIPYPGGNWTHEFVDQLSSGYRLSAPKYGNEDIYDLMMNCMKKEASERPDFSAITFKLQNLKTSLFPGSSAERANCIYIDINPQNV